MIDWSQQRDSLHPQNSLIAFSPVSPQMLNLDSQPHWQSDVRQQMTSFKQEAGGGGWGCEILTNSESSVHIISRP